MFGFWLFILFLFCFKPLILPYLLELLCDVSNSILVWLFWSSFFVKNAFSSYLLPKPTGKMPILVFE